MKLFYRYLFNIMFLVPYLCSAQQSKIDSLQAIISLGKQDLETARAFSFISDAYIRTDVEKAKLYLWKGKYVAKKIGKDKVLSAIYSQLTSINHNQGLIDSVHVYLTLLKNLADKASGDDANSIKGNYYATAGLFYKKSGNIKEALPFLINAHTIAKQIGDITASSGQAINIGNSYLALSNFNSALEYYVIALKGFEQVGNKKGLSFCYQNIGECYIELKQYKSALDYINKSYKLKTELNDKRGLGNAEQSLGKIYMGFNNFDRALSHYSKALSLSREGKLLTEEAKINYYMGKLFVENNDAKLALQYFEKSKEQGRKLTDSALVAASNLEILALSKNQFKETENQAIENVLSLKDAGLKSKEIAGYKNLADYYTERKEFDKALEYTIKYNALSDSIKTTEIQAQFKTIEEAYFKEKNEKQISILQNNEQINQEKIKQQRSLLTMFGIVVLFSVFGIWMLVNKNRLRNQMKELELRNQIASDLHDEVGSSLSSIYMLSQMAGQTEFDSKGDILNKVKSNAFETMEKMSDIVWMIKPNEDTLSVIDRMRKFGLEICSSRNIKFTFLTDNLDHLKLTMLQNKNLYLIFKEAINNAVKYSETQKIEVSMSLKNKNLKMAIQDFGKGFDESKIVKGNGLDNMKQRALELNGKLIIDSKPSEGTKTVLNFPISLKS